jgi:hypothetical protein
MLLKVVALHLETQADTTLHVPECCRQRSGRNVTNRAGSYRVSAAKYTALLIFVFICKLLHIL